LNDEQKELFYLIFTDKVIEEELTRFYYLFYKYLEMFAKIIVETQYVGSYVNAAMLVNSCKFCIPKFRYSGDNYIKMKDFVHPYLIDGGVRNSFELGEKETGIRNMIFSGSNGTGKTTFQFAVVDNVILAQSLGIACCSEYSATPFDKIISMSNAKTDLSEGLSGYTSEVEMVKDCLSYLSENKDKRILLISDEPLSTTDPDFADWIVGLIFRGVFSYPNVTSIVATHFNKPGKIERLYKDLHAGNFRFKVEDKGTSLENFHLLEHGEGCNIGKTIAKQRGLLDLVNALTVR
jgi:DNA mismatch repair ATPase MutS